eukprot:scaffold4788_cov82-Skeletonema_menzelii.AAC.11
MERLNSKEGNLKVKMEKIVLMAKKPLLAFYVRNGFRAMGLSSIVHGQEQWFELERDLPTHEDANKHKCFLLDSFADVATVGSGNPAGVVLLDESPGGVTSNNSFDDEELDDIMEDADDNNVAPVISPRGVEWMAAVAKEFNQSETAFIWPLPNAPSSSPTAYAIRYYTRTGMEVDLCGHATLASAAVLLGTKQVEGNNVTFYAKNEELQAELIVSPSSPPSLTTAASSNNNSNASRIAMDFPWKDVSLIPSGGEDHKAVLNMLSNAFFGSSNKAEVESDLTAKFCAFFNPKDQSHALFSQHILGIGTTDEKEDLFIELTEEGKDSSEGESGGNRPGCKTAIDFRSRFFGPKVGIDEDPVTGSAHCSLGPYFGTKLGKKVVIGKQESDRGGLVECILNQEEGRVCIVGTAVMTISGMLSMPI